MTDYCEDCKYCKKYFTCFQMIEANYYCIFYDKPIERWYDSCRHKERIEDETL